MMRIILSDAGKRFNRDWIFRKLSYSFIQGNAYAITGANGSGKSTLLQVLSGSMNSSEGNIKWMDDNTEINNENVYQLVSLVAPYLEVIEEMTATEFLRFHAGFKPLQPNISIPQIIELIGLQQAADKQIRFYSSGMKQRVKLAQAIFSNAPILLLDEPCTNLDAAGYDLYHQLIQNYCSNKLIIVSSNDSNEYDFCKEKISITDYKV